MRGLVLAALGLAAEAFSAGSKPRSRGWARLLATPSTDAATALPLDREGSLVPAPLLSARDLELFFRQAEGVRRPDAKHLVVVASEVDGTAVGYAVLAQRLEDEQGEKVSSWWSADFDLVGLQAAHARLDEEGLFVLDDVEETTETSALLLAAMELLLTSGGRPHQLRLTAKGEGEMAFLKGLGIEVDPASGAARADPDAMREAAATLAREAAEGAELLAASALNVRGRLEHAAQRPELAVASYTEALQLLNRANDTADAGGVRLKALAGRAALAWLNLGSAYAAQEDDSPTMAAAAWQRSIELSPEGFALPYFKLGQMYLSQAGIQGKKKKLEGAGDHAVQCFRYFCSTDDGPANTDALTALGNAHLHLLEPEEAVEIYGKALEVDPSLWNVELNRAQAFVQLQNFDGAAQALRSAIDKAGDGELPQAEHMLLALEARQSERPETPPKASKEYLLQLFDDAYANSYDALMRKRIYAAPRIMRTLVREGLNRTEFAELPPGVKAMNNNSVLPWITGSLRTLDLGCGTGLTAAWLRDYSKTLVGVDLSPSMIRKARGREVFDELVESDIEEFLAAYDGEAFDAVTAASPFLYIGKLDALLAKVPRVLRPGGILAFTVDTVEGAGASEGYTLTEGGTYAHDPEYVKRCVEAAGMQLLEDTRPFSSRLERGDPRPGLIVSCVLPKASSK